MRIIHVNAIIPVISTLLKKQILLIIFLYVSLLSTMPPKPSYRRNRDYTKQFGWTYDLKKNVYSCYLRAKENPKIGYMMRLKNYWDKLHPEFNFLSNKNLKDQASRIEENKIVMETEYGTIITITSENMLINEDNCLESSNIENTSGSIIISTIMPLDESQKMLLEILRPIFERNYEIVKNQSIDQRVYPTKCNKSVTDDVIKVIDFLASNTIKEIREPSYFDINTLLYTSAVTAKEHLNDLK